MKTLTSRMGLPQWSEPSDPVGRQDFNQAFGRLEDRSAIDDQGPRSSRPNPGVRGRYYFATDLNTLYRDNGTSWTTVGAVVDGSIATAPNVSTPAGVYRGVNNQSADILQIQNNAGDTLWSVTRHGALKAGGVYVAGNGDESASERLGNASLAVSPMGASLPALVVQGLSGQSASPFQVRNSSGTVTAHVTAGGEGTFTALHRASAGTPSNVREFVTYGFVEDTYLRKTGAASTYATKSELTSSLSPYITTSTVNNLFLSKADASSTYATAGHVHEATLLGTQNLNDVTGVGEYIQLTAANATTARNYPVGSRAGHLEVMRRTASSHVYQRYIEHHADTNVWTRYYNGSSWSAWVRLANAKELDDKVVNVSGVASIRKVTRTWYESNSHDANTLYIVV